MIGDALRYTVRRCSLGWVSVARSGAGLRAVALGDDPEALLRDVRSRFPGAEPVTEDDLIAAAVRLVESPGLDADLPLDIEGTEFERRVWQALREIPSGTTAAYSAIAARIGAPDARDVAAACAANPLAVVIPCHRVIRKGGGIGGYRWGVRRKRVLLAREAAARRQSA